jgi:hypothetical protein
VVRIGRWATWVSCGVLTVAGCKDAAGPAVPEEDFSLKVQNEIQQNGVDPAGAQVAVRFSVSLPGDVSPTDVSKIQLVDILWPNNYVRTPILSGFQPDGDSLTATRLLPDRTEGLPAGTYTLEVLFQDGQQISDRVYCDGNMLGSPVVQSLTKDSASLQIAVGMPNQELHWTMYLERVQPAPDSVLVTLPGGFGGFGTLRAAFDYDFQPDEAYALVMELENLCNHRVVRIPLQ